MSITEAQRADRKNHLGSSDLPAILGFSRFANAYDIWLEKTGRIVHNERTEDYITAGNLFEKPVIEWFREYIGQAVQEQDAEHDMERKVADLPIVVHLDGVMEETGDPVEVKTAGLYGPIQTLWGETGTDEVPEYECIQTHCHLMATDREICHVPTFLGGRGFGYFFVKRDNAIVDLIREQAIRFWEDNVLKDIPPENCAPTLAMAKRIRHVESDPVALDEEAVQMWLTAKERAKEAQAVVDFHHAELLAALDGRDMGTCALGDITHFEQNRKGYEVQPASFRVMRLKKAKK